MPRRVSLPAAEDLFRRTGGQPTVRAVPDQPDQPDQPEPPVQPTRARRPSGRVRHDEKMTVYVTSAELLHLEHARLALRAEHGLAIDRGRLVREAVAMVLADLEEHGADSALVRRLTED